MFSDIAEIETNWNWRLKQRDTEIKLTWQPHSYKQCLDSLKSWTSNSFLFEGCAAYGGFNIGLSDPLILYLRPLCPNSAHSERSFRCAFSVSAALNANEQRGGAGWECLCTREAHLCKWSHRYVAPVWSPFHQQLGCRSNAGLMRFPHSVGWKVQGGPAQYKDGDSELSPSVERAESGSKWISQKWIYVETRQVA